jgi:hypothetical protein
VRSVFGSGLDAERGSEGAPDVGDGVFGGVVFKKPWATRPDVERLPKGDLDVGEVGVG